jgi:hypothetical protein
MSIDECRMMVVASLRQLYFFNQQKYFENWDMDNLIENGVLSFY